MNRLQSLTTAIPVVLIILVISGAFLAFYHGLHAARRIRSHDPEDYALALTAIALNLCEPVLNSIVVLICHSLFIYESRDIRTFNIGVALLPSTTITFSLLGLASSRYYATHRRLLLLLIGRWGAGFFAWFTNYQLRPFLNPGVFWVLILCSVAIALGLTWYTALWGRRQLAGPLAHPPTG